MPAAVGVVGRRSIVEQQRFAVPVEPEVLVFLLGIEEVVNLLHHIDGIAVEAPEAYLGHLVAFALHVLEHGEQGVPFVPVAHGVGHIEDKHVDAGIGEHRYIVAYDVGIGREEVAHLRLAPVIRAVVLRLPGGVAGLLARVGVLLQHLAHIGPVRIVHVVEVGRVPCDIEDADRVLLAVLVVAHF